MNRKEWALVVALSLVAVLTICAVPPPQIDDLSPQARVAASATAAPAVSAAASVAAPAPITPTLQIAVPPTTAAPTARPMATRATPTATPTATTTPRATATATPSPTFAPEETRPDLARFLYIDQRSQQVYVYELGERVRTIPCSTGKPDDDSYTPAASGEVGVYVTTFFSFGTHQDDAWYLFQSAGGIYIHGLPYTYNDAGEKVYQDRDLLGVRPSSHGCVRIAPEDAVWLTEWNPAGVPFEVSDPYLDEWR